MTRYIVIAAKYIYCIENAWHFKENQTERHKSIEWSRIEQHETEVLLVCCAAKHAPRQASEQANEQRHQQQPNRKKETLTCCKQIMGRD